MKNTVLSYYSYLCGRGRNSASEPRHSHRPPRGHQAVATLARPLGVLRLRSPSAHRAEPPPLAVAAPVHAVAHACEFEPCRAQRATLRGSNLRLITSEVRAEPQPMDRRPPHGRASCAALVAARPLSRAAPQATSVVARRRLAGSPRRAVAAALRPFLACRCRTRCLLLRASGEGDQASQPGLEPGLGQSVESEPWEG